MGAEPENKIPWTRYLHALWRYKWLVLAGPIAGAALGMAVTRRAPPKYEVHATIWLAGETPEARAAGPIRAERLLSISSWPDLVTSFAVLDSVAIKARLTTVPDGEVDSPLLAGLSTDREFATGHFVLHLDRRAKRYTLVDQHGATVDQGAFGDSIGRSLGFRWALPANPSSAADAVGFTMYTPRDAANALRLKLGINLQNQSSLLRLSLTGTDPKKTTETMSLLVSEFVATATRLKTRNLVEFANTLEQQLAYASQELRNAEIALESFRVRTITLPSEAGTIAAGLEMTRDPVMRHYFDQKLSLDSIRSDREQLEGVLNGMKSGQVGTHVLWSIPSVSGSRDLTASLLDLAAQQSVLRSALSTYTEQHKSVIDARARIAQLEQTVIPQLTSALLDNVRRRERDLQDRVNGSSRELQQIPTRTIEEMRLRRNVDVRQQFYTMLKSRYEEARLSEASSHPDLSVLDYPALPDRPVLDSTRRLQALATVGCFGLALALALLLDTTDRRFRYPEQATKGMGLDIIGVVPRVRNVSSQSARDEQSWQIIEAFRSIRLGLTYAQGGHMPLLVTITSPASGDGKSLVASNLALSFADAGFNTLLLDADVRRGILHTSLGARKTPGLTDVLSGSASVDDAITTTSAGVAFIPAGTRDPRAPELLTSNRMVELMGTLRDRYSIVIVDSAPLAAGIDSLVLGTLTTNMLLVLRNGQTDTKLAEAKLKMLDRLPVRVLGTVLNAVNLTGTYRYYSYQYEYGMPKKKKSRFRIGARAEN